MWGSYVKMLNNAVPQTSLILYVVYVCVGYFSKPTNRKILIDTRS